MAIAPDRLIKMLMELPSDKYFEVWHGNLKFYVNGIRKLENGQFDALMFTGENICLHELSETKPITAYDELEKVASVIGIYGDTHGCIRLKDFMNKHKEALEGITSQWP